MNKRRLNVLADHLDTINARKFDMDHWVGTYDKDYPRDEGKKSKCGTTACALGYAGYIPSFRRAGLKTIAHTDGYSRGGRVELETKNGMEYNGFMAAMEFFDLTSAESDFIFDPESYEGNDRVGPKTVARRIRKMIKEGGVPAKFAANHYY